MTLGASPQTLLFDADDTLWENNVLFERAISGFISYLGGVRHTPTAIRQHLDAVERRTVTERGYGTESFCISLKRCYEDLSGYAATAAQQEEINGFSRSITNAPIELLPGVYEAVESLSQRHRLILVTKGADLEQREKLSRSGLAHLFAEVEVLREKDAAAYRDVAARHGCDPSCTWMIGNSPKSDINPALEAGLNAVFVPHPETWILEHELLIAVPAGRRLLEVVSLRELASLL